MPTATAKLDGTNKCVQMATAIFYGLCGLVRQQCYCTPQLRCSALIWCADDRFMGVTCPCSDLPQRNLTSCMFWKFYLSDWLHQI
eukprot:scaffold450611_cov18-Prasinocladus_malaysianus.AAC.1